MFCIKESEFKYSFLYMFISDFIGNYIYKHGTRYNKSNYDKLIFPVLNCLFSDQIKLNIMIPILLLQYAYRSAIVHGNSNKEKLSYSKYLKKDCYSIALDIFSSILKSIVLNNTLINSKDIPQEIDNMMISMFSK